MAVIFTYNVYFSWNNDKNVSVSEVWTVYVLLFADQIIDDLLIQKLTQLLCKQGMAISVDKNCCIYRTRYN
jgi:hypothetical protein